MAQGAEFPLRKPPGFHYDFMLLGITTFIAGLLGLPAPNGLIPQAPIHTTSLQVMARATEVAVREKKAKNVQPHILVESEDLPTPAGFVSTANVSHAMLPSYATMHYTEYPISVVEQRVSNLVQGTLCLVLLTKPFLHLLSLIPRGLPLLVLVFSFIINYSAQVSWRAYCRRFDHCFVHGFISRDCVAGLWA